jgi:predicted MFS family arabinose efflux permease
MPAPGRTLPPWIVILLSGAMVMSLGTGVRQVSGLFLRPVSLDLGMSLEAFGTIVAIQNLLWGLSQPLAGALADRHGARPVAFACGLLYAAGLGLAAAAGSVPVVILGLGVCCGLGQAGTTYAVVLAVIGRSAPADSRGLAVGLGSAAGSIGMFLLVPAASLLIDGLGWRGSMAVLALLMLLAPACALALREERPAPSAVPAASPGAILRETLRDRDFWLLNLGFASCGLQLAFIATYLPMVLIEGGLDISVGAMALAAIGLCNIAGTYAAGLAGDHWPRARVLVLVYLARAAAILGFLVLPLSPASAIGFGALIGLLWTSTVPLTNGLVAALWGRRNLGLLFGLVFVGHQLGAFAGAWIGGWVRDRTGSFDAAWALILGLSLSAALCHILLRERPRGQALAEGTA